MKRKIGLIVGYSGKGYHGLQWNKDVATLEKAIMDVFLENKLVTELNATDAQKIDLKASSRTDKGVHASFNLIQAKICQEPSAEIEASLRTGLSLKGIHLYKMIRLPKKFLGYKMARSRIYKYFVPTYFIKESNYTEEYLKRAEEDATNENTGNVGNEQIAANVCGDDSSAGDEDNNTKATKSIYRNYSEKDLEEIYGYKASNIEDFRSAVLKYVGTHNFSNFTVKTHSKSNNRFIRSVVVSEPTTIDNVEYVEVTIHGQSFLLHQIRKMISFAVLNTRYSSSKIDSHFERAFSQPLHIPKAPAQYLYLSSILFEDYNQRAAEKIEIEEESHSKFESNVIQPLIYKSENLYEWLKYFDAVRFHHNNFEIFKE